MNQVINNESYSSSSKILICVRSIDLSGTREIYIRTNLVTRNIDSLNCGTSGKILDSIPIDVDNYSTLR